MKSTRFVATTQLLALAAFAVVMAATRVWGQEAPGAQTPKPTGTAAAPATPAPKLTPVVEPKLLPPPLPPDAPKVIPLDHPITLDEAIAVGLQHQPQLTISTGSAQSAAGRTVEAKSAERPDLSLSAQYNKSGPANRGGATPGTSFNAGIYTASLSGRQLLYDFGRTPASIAAARDQQVSAEQAYRQTRQDVITNVKQGYYTLLGDQRLVEVQKGNLSDQQAHLDLAQARFDVGVAPRADVYRAEAAVEQARFTLMQAVTAAAQARVDLNVAMGIDTRLPTQVTETQEPMPPMPPLTELVEQAYLQRPEIQQLRASVQAAEEGVKVAQTTNAPSISLDASYGWSGTTFPPNNRSWSYGVALSWPFYDGGFTKGAIEVAKGNLLSAQGQLCLGQETVAQDVARAYLNVQSAAVQVETAAAAVKSSQEAVSVSNGRYEAGVATFVEVLDAQTTLIQSRIAQVAAQYGLSLARAGLAHALGEEGR